MSGVKFYDVGDVAVLRFCFTSRALTQAERETFEAGGGIPTGVGVQPSTVTVTVLKPDGTTATPAVVAGTGANVGIYTAEQALDQEGSWWWASDGTGGQQASGERRLEVRQTRVPRS